MPGPYCLDDYGFVIELECRIVMPPALVFLFQHSSGYSGSFLVQTNFQFICSSSVKTVDGILIGVALNVWIALGSIDILIIFVLPICEHFFLCLAQFLKCSVLFRVQILSVFG